MVEEMVEEKCPLCLADGVTPYHEDKKRQYLQCTVCKLIFVPAVSHVTCEREKQEYELHDNNCDDEGYLKFLSRFTTPFLKRLGHAKKGLDFGCGPAPAVANLLRQHGHEVALFDPFYMDNPRVLELPYDFVSSTEVVEHFRRPGKEFELLFTLLKPGGWLGLMTKMVSNQSAFSTWHYIRDLTHVSFYQQDTFTYIAVKYGAQVSFEQGDLIFMQKNG
jgi:SAM-dependent methyltransferase